MAVFVAVRPVGASGTGAGLNRKGTVGFDRAFPAWAVTEKRTSDEGLGNRLVRISPGATSSRRIGRAPLPKSPVGGAWDHSSSITGNGRLSVVARGAMIRISISPPIWETSSPVGA